MVEESLDIQLEAAAAEGLSYLRNALRGGAYDPELLQTARFLVEVKLAHDHRHGETDVFSYDDDDEDEDEEDEDEEDDLDDDE
jgi:hypothetical protein